MFTTLISFIPTIIVLGLLIFVHELGHFVCAKLSGVCVEKFSIGFGPELFKWKRKGTEYVLALVPIGGFVKMAGETFDERDDGALRSDDFLAQSVWKRFVILFAGSFMNYLLAFVLLVIVFMNGAPTLSTRIGDVLKDSPAYRHGIQTDDTIVAVNGSPITQWDALTEAIQKSEGAPLVFTVRRGEKDMTLSFAPKTVESKDIFGDTHRVYQIGVASANELLYTKYGSRESFFRACAALGNLTALTYKSIFRLVTGRLSLKVMSGPLGIIDMASKTAQKGILPLMHLTAYIGVFLAVFNLLPFPALDGGHIFFLLIEMIFRKPVSFHMQERFSQVGFILLMCLMVVVVYNDIDRFGWIDRIRTFFSPG